MRKRAQESGDLTEVKSQRTEKKKSAQSGRPPIHRSKPRVVPPLRGASRATKTADVSSSSPEPDPEAAEFLSAGDGDLVVPPTLPFKLSQLEDRYPKGQKGGNRWKNLKQILQAENSTPRLPNEPTYSSIESPPSLYPAKKYCDITGFEAPYTDPRTKLRYADAETFMRIRNLPDEYIQGLLALRSAQIILK